MSDSEEEKKLKRKLLIEELRITFTNIETLDNALESKASAFFGFTAITVSIIVFALNSILSTNSLSKSISYSANLIIQKILFFLVIICILVIFRGLIYLLEVIKPREYTYPFTDDPNIMLKKIDMSCEELENEIIEDYRDTIPHHKCITIKKEVVKEKFV